MFHPHSVCRLNYVRYIWTQLVFFLMPIDDLVINILKNIAWQCFSLWAFFSQLEDNYKSPVPVMWLPHTATILQIGQSSTWCRGHRPHRGVCRDTTHPAHLSRMAACVRDVETLQGHRASPTLCPCRVVSAWSRLCRGSGALSTPTFMNLVRGLWDFYLWCSKALGVHLQTLNYIPGGCCCQRNELHMLLNLCTLLKRKYRFWYFIIEITSDWSFLWVVT